MTEDIIRKVADRLGTTVDFPEYCEIGNSAGAALLGRK